MTTRRQPAATPPLREPKRCAVYTRKSTTAGLEQDFNSLDAQREACEQYIRSQAALGWQLISEPYDDGGFSGANLERPAFARLMQDVEAGKIDVVVVYKVDRLSRSLPTLTRGDEVNFPVAVYNYLDTAQTVRVEMQPADWFTSLGATGIDIAFGPGQVTGARFPVRVDKVGRQTMTVKGTGGTVSDAVARSVLVVPDGQAVPVTASGTLGAGTITSTVNFPAAAVTGSQQPRRRRGRGQPGLAARSRANVAALTFAVRRETPGNARARMIRMPPLAKSGSRAPGFRSTLVRRYRRYRGVAIDRQKKESRDEQRHGLEKP